MKRTLAAVLLVLSASPAFAARWIVYSSTADINCSSYVNGGKLTTSGNDIYCADDTSVGGKGGFTNIVISSVTTFTGTNSTSFVDTPLKVTITPSATNSNVLITASFMAGIAVGGQSAFYTISSSVSGNLMGSSGGSQFTVSANDSVAPASLVFLDTPMTMSPVTYTVRFHGTAGTQAYFGNTNLTSTIVAQEIGATGGGNPSTLAITTGAATGFSATTSSPTAVINFSSDTFKASLKGGATAFVTLNPSSVTLQGVLFAGSNITLTPGAGVTTIAASGVFSTINTLTNGATNFIWNSATPQSSVMFNVSSGTANELITSTITIKGTPTGDSSGVNRSWVVSRGQNLVTNGSGLLGNNYNFSHDFFGGTGFTFDPIDTHGGGGSFRANQAYAEFVTDEFMPVDSQKTYRLVAWGKSGDTDGSNYNASNLQLVGVVTYDADQLNIEPLYFSKHSGSTDTTIAVQVNPGATTITLTNATGWYNGTANAAINQMSWWPYVNSKGYSYPNYTYTRNTSYYLYSGGYTYVTDGLWGTGGISGNVITLTHPWTGPILPVGTPVRNSESGGTFRYITMVGAVPNTWTRYEGYIGGIDVNGTQDLNKFPYGTAYIKPVFLLDYHGAADNNIRWSDIWFSEMSAANLETASGTQIGVVLPGTQTLGGKKTVQAQASTDKPLIVQGASSQSADLQEWQDSATNPVLSVGPSGTIISSSGNESTGAGTALLGSNSPASTNTAPYKWIKFKTSDGSTVYIPAWK